MPPNNANQHELESTVFIVAVWACEGLKATKTRRSPFQSRYWRRWADKVTPKSVKKGCAIDECCILL